MKMKVVGKIVWRVVPYTLLAIAVTTQLFSNLAAKFASRSASTPAAARVAKFDAGTLELVSSLPDLTVKDYGTFAVPVSFTVSFPQTEVACTYGLKLTIAPAPNSSNEASFVCPSLQDKMAYYTVTSAGYEKAASGAYAQGETYYSLTSSKTNGPVSSALEKISASEIKIQLNNQTIEIGESHTYAFTVFLQNQTGSNDKLKLGGFDISYEIHTEQVD